MATTSGVDVGYVGSTRRPRATRVPWILLTIAVIYLAVAWFWKRAFVWGESSGPYWLFVAMDWTVMPLLLLSAIGLIAAGAMSIVRLIRREPAAQAVVLANIAWLLATVAFFGASLPSAASGLTHVDSVGVERRTYRLAEISALADLNYALFACDRYGFQCRQVYRSGDVASSEWGTARLTYDTSTNTLSVVVGERVLHTLQPPLASARIAGSQVPG